MPIQQMLLGVGAKKKTYMDDVFSTYLHTGTGSSNSINNSINLSGEGGLVWIKQRNDAVEHFLFDTERGALKPIHSDANWAEYTANNTLTSFNSNGYTLGSSNYVNGTTSSPRNYTGFTFRKAPGFFDIVTYTGNFSSRTISHSLGCVPGMILIKKTSGSAHWVVYHRGNADSNNAAHYALRLNSANAKADFANYFNDTLPTASVFTLGADNDSNANGETYVAYLFAGGASTASTARSVDFDGVGNWDRRLGIAASSDFTVGTNFTAECWYNCRSTPYTNTHHIMGQWDGNSGSESKNSWSLQHYNNQLRFYWVSGGSLYYKSMGNISKKVWHHFAFVKSGSTTKLFIDGEQLVADFDTGSIQDGTGKFTIGGQDGGSGDFDGKVSNVRIVNGTAVYTNSFRPPVEPLTNITNTKLLCCNNSSITGSTVTPGTITAYNSPTASTVHPFDDPAGFVFGDAGDQNIIKCGSYVGNGSSTGPEINLGWEPQWILLKNADATKDWKLFDCMRGLSTNAGDDRMLSANINSVEVGADVIDITSTGFKPVSDSQQYNGDGHDMIYIAIRRPDGYVGKPPELGTGVFAMDTGAGSSTIPNFDSTFPVDFSLMKQPASSAQWYANARLIGIKELAPNTSGSEAQDSSYVWDSNVGWGNGSWQNSGFQSWMFKRHAGFDVVTRLGSSSQTDQSHSLGQVPEMIWAKIRNNNENWAVYHKGLNGGTNPEQYRLTLDNNGAEASSSTAWASKAPTSTHFFVGNDADTNGTNDDYIYMLFSSVDGISKVGSYAGSSSAVTVTLGFSPRLIILKNATSTNWWVLHDTMRGLATSSGGTSQGLYPAETTANTATTSIHKTSTGFVLATGGGATYNASGSNYIYYAHV